MMPDDNCFIHIIDKIYPINDAASINGILLIKDDEDDMEDEHSNQNTIQILRLTFIKTLIEKLNISIEKLYDILSNLKNFRKTSNIFQQIIDMFFNIKAIDCMMDSIIEEFKSIHKNKNPICNLINHASYYDADIPIYIIVSNIEIGSIYDYSKSQSKIREMKKKIPVFNRPTYIKEVSSNKLCPSCHTTLPIKWMTDEQLNTYGTCSEECTQKFKERFQDHPIKCNYLYCNKNIHMYDISDLGWRHFCSDNCWDEYEYDKHEFHRSDYRDDHY